MEAISVLNRIEEEKRADCEIVKTQKKKKRLLLMVMIYKVKKLTECETT